MINYHISRLDHLTPKRAALVLTARGVSDAAVNLIAAKLAREGLEVRGCMETSHGYRLVRVFGPIAVLNRIERHVTRHTPPLWPTVIRVLVGRHPTDGPSGAIPPDGNGPRVYAAPESLHARIAVVNLLASTSIDDMLRYFYAHRLNLTQGYTDRRTGALLGVLDVKGPSWRIMDLESAILDRGLFRELRPVIELSTSAPRRGMCDETEVVRFYGQGSEPGVYLKLREAVSDVVDAICVHLQEIEPIDKDLETSPWQGEASFSFRSGINRNDGLRSVTAALDSLRLKYEIGLRHASWTALPPPAGTGR